MNLPLLLFLFVWLGFSPLAHGGDAKTPPQPAEANAAKNVTGEDVDEVITNKKLRAESGSKSRYSIATFWNYKGGSIESPFDEQRPNITGSSNNTAYSFLSADLNGKFAFDQRHSIFVGFGIRWITPLQGGSTPPHFNNKFDANDPIATYRYIYKTFGFQNILVSGLQFWTSQDNHAKGYVNDFILQQTSVHEIGRSGLSLGFAVSSEFNTFDSGNPSLYSRQTDLRFGIFPILEYQFTERLGFRTLVGAYFEHRRSQDAWTFTRNKVYQSMGFGISITRDIFLYPNLQFIPDQLRPNETNVALSANINIF